MTNVGKTRNHCVAGQLKQGSCLWSVSTITKVHPGLMHSHMFWPEKDEASPEQRWHLWRDQTEEEVYFCMEECRVIPWSSMFVTVISVVLFLMSEPSTCPLACCLATCAEPCWVAGPWQGVSLYVRSGLRDYSLTCCLPDWHPLERSTNHMLQKQSAGVR